jgi:hypothetical protein
MDFHEIQTPQKTQGKHRKYTGVKRFSMILVLLLTILACSLPVKKTPIKIDPPITSLSEVPLLESANTLLPEPSATLEPSPLPTETPASTKTPSPTETRIPPATPTFTPIPTYAILRGKVNVERVSCRYGPGWMYLYLYGMLQGVTQDVLGRTDTGTWVLTQSHGDNISCWVKTEFLDLSDDVMSLEVVYPDKYTIPPSNQNYSFPYDVAAVRSGSQVTISWKSEALRPGDEEDADMVIYIIETWTCTDGQVTFKPIGTSYTQVTVIDEAGCSTPSHGRIYFQDKHGFTGPSEIPWP